MNAALTRTVRRVLILPAGAPRLTHGGGTLATVPTPQATGAVAGLHHNRTEA